ncbi:MAG TPA: M28 family peptidase [Bacteroidia bacterium]|nr:M28 family peptidase [Bacteroidia bacterium]
MHGRGYVKKGDQNASIYISKEFQFAGLEKLSKGYYQEFTHSVNTFPSSMYVKLDTAVLQAGVQFIVDPKSPSAKGSYLIEETNALPDQYSERALRYRFVYVNPKGLSSEDSLKLMAAWKEDKRAAGYIFRHKKLTWSVGTEVMEKPMIYLLNDSVAKSFKHIELSIKNKFISRYKSRNVVAYVKGKVKPDSMIVVSAHYDHLGRMGKTALFPGANDNASGVALMLNLVKHYALTENKPDYSILFIAFAAEEAGLKGSLHYTQNPLKPLSKIKFLINLDLTGTGDEGITVVNATEFPEHFDRIKKINEEENYFTYVGSRGKAKNSDHYYFSEAGVPSFFIYTMGGIKAYHDIYDIPETLPLTRYRQLFRLIDDFIKGIH